MARSADSKTGGGPPPFSDTAGGNAGDIEESLALFMQVKLSQARGYTEATRHMSDKYPENAPKGAILRSLEAGWVDYQANHTQDIIQYLLHQTIGAF
jgi:hypothetical protein